MLYEVITILVRLGVERQRISGRNPPQGLLGPRRIYPALPPGNRDAGEAPRSPYSPPTVAGVQYDRIRFCFRVDIWQTIPLEFLVWQAFVLLG